MPIQDTIISIRQRIVENLNGIDLGNFTTDIRLPPDPVNDPRARHPGFIQAQQPPNNSWDSRICQTEENGQSTL